MKKDRNCPGGYPSYGNVPMYGAGMNPMMYGGAMPMPIPMPNTFVNDSENQISTLTNQVNNLEQRVNALENIVNKSIYSNNYNTSNYQMM